MVDSCVYKIYENIYKSWYIEQCEFNYFITFLCNILYKKHSVLFQLNYNMNGSSKHSVTHHVRYIPSFWKTTNSFEKINTAMRREND
jgi:hypothetical protein